MRSGTQDKEHEDMLANLVEMLMSQPMTAIDVAQAMRCGKPTAYRRIRELEKRGICLIVEEVAGRSGPSAAVYRVVRRLV